MVCYTSIGRWTLYYYTEIPSGKGHRKSDPRLHKIEPTFFFLEVPRWRYSYSNLALLGLGQEAYTNRDTNRTI